MRFLLLIIACVAVLAAAEPVSEESFVVPEDQLPKSEEEWRQRLSPEQYRVCRGQGTERPFANAYWDTKTPGTYRCAACGVALFSSADKFDSGSGWPSYTQPLDGEAVGEAKDTSHGMTRTEVHCERCGSHLGHLFEDGPAPTGMRYCINSAALQLEAEAQAGDGDGAQPQGGDGAASE